MSERYSYLYTLPQNLYTVGSPVLISAGTLLKDNQNGRIIAQLKFRSISNKIIKAVKVKLNLFDTAGNPIGESVVYDYLDLSVSRDVEFGQKTPVTVSDNKARSYSVAVTEVVFGDRSVWNEIDGKWEPLSRPQRLILDDELLKQYQITFGNDSKYEPKEEKDLWYCTCGELNRKGEMCYACRNTLTTLQAVDMTQLAKEKDVRLEAEAKEADKLAQKAIEEKAARDAANREIIKKIKVIGCIACVVIAIVLLVTEVIIPNIKYNNAITLQSEGKTCEAAMAFGHIIGYKDAWKRSSALWDKIASRETVDADAYHTVGLCADGTVVATGGNGNGECNVENWTAIIAVSTGHTHTVGLRADGTVVATGYNRDGRCNVEDWTDIVAISAGGLHTVGLRADGTVVATGDNEYGQCDVENWTDVVAISADAYHTVGLCADGTVVATGDNEYGQCDVENWTDVVAISAGYSHTVGLRADGTVVATGKNNDGQCDVEDWTDIVAISAGSSHTVALRTDGTVGVVAEKWTVRNELGGWKNIKIPN